MTLVSLVSSKIESFEINNQQISRKSLSSQYGVDFDLSQKIFLFFSKQSKTIKTYNQNDLFAIIAGIITFSPDRRYNLSQHAQNGKFFLSSGPNCPASDRLSVKVGGNFK